MPMSCRHVMRSYMVVECGDSESAQLDCGSSVLPRSQKPTRHGGIGGCNISKMCQAAACMSVGGRTVGL